MIQSILRMRIINVYEFSQLDTFGDLDVVSIGSSDIDCSEELHSIFYSFDYVPVD